MRVSKQVENILMFSRKARNSDKELQVIYMQKFGMNLTEEQKELFHQMPSFETIRRTRQALQMQGKYLADQKVEEARYNKFREMKHSTELKSPAAIVTTLDNAQLL